MVTSQGAVMNVPVKTSAPPIDRELVRRTVANGATNDELELYLYDCARRNVHPLDKLLHFTKRGGRYTPVTSIDLMRSRAADTGQMAGSDPAVFDVGGSVGGPPLSASVTVYRITQGQRYAYTGTAQWAEYNTGGTMWQKMPRTMLSKCAEALALRKAFPQELAGLYSGEEMDQAGESAATRQNPHVTRAEDLVDDTTDNIPPGDNHIRPLPKKDTRAQFEAMQKEMHATKTVEELKTWGNANKNKKQMFKPDWQEILQGLYNAHMETLKNNPETGEVADDATILAEIDHVLSMVTDPGMLERTWDYQCEVRITPDIADEAAALYSKHQARLS
jgi:phage recombination protein Bet